jgi:hypothetical protein
MLFLIKNIARMILILFKNICVILHSEINANTAVQTVKMGIFAKDFPHFFVTCLQNQQQCAFCADCGEWNVCKGGWRAASERVFGTLTPPKTR